MRRTCPYLLGALLIVLICLGGGLHQFDQLLGPATAWNAAWLPPQLASHRPEAAALALASRELAPLAAAVCLVLGPVFHRASLLAGTLLFATTSGLVLVGASAASHAGALALAPGALLAAILLALVIGTLTRLAAAAENRSPAAQGGADLVPLMPALAEQSTAAILTFDCDGRIRSCNRALCAMFGYAPSEIVGSSFGRLLDVPNMTSHARSAAATGRCARWSGGAAMASASSCTPRSAAWTGGVTGYAPRFSTMSPSSSPITSCQR
jgi:PAS domain-containing protein